MSLTSRFFKKPWQNKNPETRADAVAKSSDPELIEALPGIAQHDDAAAVRLAALRRIDTEPFWLDARLREQDASIREAADRYLKRAVTSRANTELIAERLQWLEALDDRELLKTLAQKAQDRELRARAQQGITAQGFLGDCYRSEDDPELAQALLDRIEQLSTLERLHEKLRTSSKARARAVQERIQSLKAASGALSVDEVAAKALIKDAEILARGEDTKDREARLAELRTQWSTLEEVRSELTTRFQGAIGIIESAIERASRPPEESLSDQPPGTPPEVEPDSPLHAVEAKIRQALRNRSSAAQPEALLATWDRAWNALEGVSAADEAVKERILPILRELQAQIQSRSRTGDKSASEASESSTSNESFELQLDALSGHLEAGELPAAKALVGDIRAGLKRLPVRQRPRAALGRLQRLEGRLKELRDYQHWSHNKHRDELIERVEALAGSEQHPDAITTALKEARKEWRRLESLEVLPGDRRQYAAPAGQWRRFQTACQNAFETAKPYFEKRQNVQEETLGQLEAFIEQGLALAEQTPADAAKLMPVMRKARQAIRRLDDLPPKSRGAAAGKLRAMMDRISARLDEAFEKVELGKRRLINEARALAHETDLKAAIDKAKSLQAEWKRLGAGRRKVDQKLWKEFRAPIDPLFEQLDGERKAQDDAQKALLAELKTICEQAEALAKLPDDELETASGRLQGLVDEWESKAARHGGLAARFEKARRKFGDRQNALRADRQRKALEDRADLARSVQRAFQARLAGEAVDREALLSGIEAPPAVLRESLERISDGEQDPSSIEAWAREHLEAARQIAVEFEFLSGLESPAADKNLRMDFQVRRLAERMSEGAGKNDLETEVAALEARWFAALPLPEDDYQVLESRVQKSLEVLHNMMGIQ
jgi:exonuclease SbcC